LIGGAENDCNCKCLIDHWKNHHPCSSKQRPRVLLYYIEYLFFIICSPTSIKSNIELKKKRMEYPIKFFCWKLLKTISIKVKKITKNNFVQGEKNKKHANYICIMKRDWDSRAKECKKSNQ
jgi:hypothetical protein